MSKKQVIKTTSIKNQIIYQLTEELLSLNISLVDSVRKEEFEQSVLLRDTINTTIDNTSIMINSLDEKTTFDGLVKTYQAQSKFYFDEMDKLNEKDFKKMQRDYQG